MIKNGSWVEIHRIVLEPKSRATHIPEDTKKVPLELKARGFLLENSLKGKKVRIRTLAGRILTGTLITENPGYEHTFGEPIPELLTIGEELKSILTGKNIKDTGIG